LVRARLIISDSRQDTHMNYFERTYRNKINHPLLKTFNVTIRETDLFILADTSLLDPSSRSVYKHRKYIESYIDIHPEFMTSLTPLRYDDLAPPVVRDMLKAARIANVGPMAAVAGAIAEHVGRDILNESKNVIVENGGDVFIHTEQEAIICVFAGQSPLSNKIKLRIAPEHMPAGVCTSSGTVGHSLSLGNADAVCVISTSAAVADAAATAVGNRVNSLNDIEPALKWGTTLDEVTGIIIVFGNRIGVKGRIELV